MTILITGAKGQLGKAFQLIIKEQNKKFIALSHEMLDITDLSLVRDVVEKYNIKSIINCAAYTNVNQAETDWKKAYLVNGIGVRNLAIVSKEKDLLLVHFSTDYVFDGQKTTPYTLVDDPNPLSEYGKSKLLGEKELIQISPLFILVRTSWVFGESKNNFVKKILELSKKHSKIKVVTDQIGSPTYTIDLARATMFLIEKRAYGLYHITNSGYCSRFEWAKFILDYIKWNGEIERAKSTEFQNAAKRPLYSVLDNFPTYQKLNYQLPHWKEATKQFLDTLTV